MLTHELLRAEVEAYLKKSGMAASRFGTEAAGDPSFVFDLRKGREPRSKTAYRVLGFIRARSSSEGRAA